MQFFYFLKIILISLIKKIKHIFLNKKAFKALLCFLTIIFLIFMPNYIFNENNYQISLNEYLNLQNKQKVVLDMWHIETFEGGNASRTKYLEKQALLFNKQNINCFVSISLLTEEQLVLNLKENKLPDLFSFGVGSGCFLSSYLQPLSKNSLIREDLQEYAMQNNKILAYPYILSGYCLISHQDIISTQNNFISQTINKKNIKGITFANNSFLNPSQILLLNGYSNLNKNDYIYSNSTYDAYLNFVSKKSLTLLGTARDLARCKNRETNGSLNSCSYKFLSGYTEMIQCVGVVKSSNSSEYAKQFVNFLTNKQSQQNLKNYGLFSTTGEDLYEKDYINDFEEVLNKKLTSINVFSSQEEIYDKRQKSFNNLFNKNI